MPAKGSITTKEPIRDMKVIDKVTEFLLHRHPGIIPIWQFGLRTALRYSDIRQIKVRDILYSSGKPKKYLILREKKRRKANRILIDEDMALIAQWGITNLFWTPERYIASGGKPQNTPFATSYVNMRLREAAEFLELEEPISTHTMRKTSAYLVFKATKSIYDVHVHLNHSNLTHVHRYLRVDQESKDENIIGISKMLRGTQEEIK